MSSTLRIHVTLALILIYFTFARPATRDTLRTRTMLLIESECVDRNSNNERRKLYFEIVMLSICIHCDVFTRPVNKISLNIFFFSINLLDEVIYLRLLKIQYFLYPVLRIFN